MTLVRFLDSDGHMSAEVEVPAGEPVLKAAQNAGQPLEGTCEGQMACSTCHVLVMSVDGEAPAPPSEEEEDMLDFAYGATRQSRLSCQLMATEQLREIVLRMPGGSVDMSR
jgi:ferredoxin|tara:strand:- start:1217 stop:1549 length:333 start_codon:yes stop_codon:yes gene_type:complete